MSEKIELNATVQKLLAEVNDRYPDGSVFVQFGDQKTGYVRHDQASQKVLPGGLFITVNDVTAPDYTASHELLHLLMLLQGFPQIFFSLSLGNAQLDEQMMIMATDLYDVAMHRVVVEVQRQHGLIDDTIEAAYLKGIQATLTPEKDGDNDERTLRLLTLLDALVFYGDHLDQVAPTLTAAYPVAFAVAQKLYAAWATKPVDSPFEMRRQIVKLFRLFDEQMQAWGLPALHNNDFTTLTPALSERQLRLKVRQVFEIFHSDMQSRHGDKEVYVGIRRNDRQNSFVLPAPQLNTPDAFVKWYDTPVQTFLEDRGIPYLVRK